MRFVFHAIFILIGAVSVFLLFAVGVVDVRYQPDQGVIEPSLSLPTYLSFLSVMLAVLTAVLAALAIGIGLIAAYTFKELKIEARSSAAQAAGDVAAEALSDVKVRAMVFELYAKAEKSREQTTEWGEDPHENEER